MNTTTAAMLAKLAGDPYALNSAMEFDHPIRVHADGRLTDDVPGIYAPEVAADDDDDIGGWTLLRGYTGQYGYNGPHMHASEYIGGRLARDILDTPGIYVAVIVSADCEACGGSWDECDACYGDPEPAGWAIAFIPDDEADETDTTADPRNVAPMHNGHPISVAPGTGYASAFCDNSPAGRWMAEGAEYLAEVLDAHCPKGCRD